MKVNKVEILMKFFLFSL